MNAELNRARQVKDSLRSGIAPIVFSYQDVVFFQKETHLVRTFMVFNSVELGTLTMKEYRFVARKTHQGVQMVNRHVIRMLRMIPKFLEKCPWIECFSIPVYPRMVLDGSLVRLLYDAFALYPGVYPSMLCFEVSADILYENIEDVKIRLRELRDLGVKVAISEVGDEYCPLFKLSDLPFDLLMLDKYTTDILGTDNADRTLVGLVSYLHSFGVPVIAPELDSNEKIANAKLIECDGYSAIHVANSFDSSRSEKDVDERVAEDAVAAESYAPSEDPEKIEDSPEAEPPMDEALVNETLVNEALVDEALADEGFESEDEEEEEYEE